MSLQMLNNESVLAVANLLTMEAYVYAHERNRCFVTQAWSLPAVTPCRTPYAHENMASLLHGVMTRNALASRSTSERLLLHACMQLRRVPVIRMLESRPFANDAETGSALRGGDRRHEGGRKGGTVKAKVVTY